MSHCAPRRRRNLEFLYRLYAECRAEELAALAGQWDTAQIEAFLRLQLQAQDAHYRRHYPDARLDLILKEGRPVGRFYVCDLGPEIRLMDIALLAGERGRGLGTALVRWLLDQAAARGQWVSLHVESQNPARRLYERLGFLPAGENGIYTLMHWGYTRASGDSLPGGC